MIVKHIIENCGYTTTIEEWVDVDDDSPYIRITQTCGDDVLCEMLEVDPELALILARLLKGWGDAQ